MLGLRWVADRGDSALAYGAREAATRIAAVLPAALRRELETSALLVGARARPACLLKSFLEKRTAASADCMSIPRTGDAVAVLPA